MGGRHRAGPGFPDLLTLLLVAVVAFGVVVVLLMI
jgi:hypothetical protein